MFDITCAWKNWYNTPTPHTSDTQQSIKQHYLRIFPEHISKVIAFSYEKAIKEDALEIRSNLIDSGVHLDNIACGHMGAPVSFVDLWRAMDRSPMPASLYRLQIGEISSRRMRKPADHIAFRDIVIDYNDGHRHVVEHAPWMEYLLSTARLPHTRLRFFLRRSTAFHCDALDKDSSPSAIITEHPRPDWQRPTDSGHDPHARHDAGKTD